MVERYQMSEKYVGYGQGNGGQIKVEVELSDSKISNVKVLDASQESKGISDPALKEVPAEIVKNQSYNVDAVSGASHTSNGIKDAVKNALEQAGIADDFSKEVHNKVVANKVGQNKFIDPNSIDWKRTDDVVVIGDGAAGLSAAIEAAYRDASVTVIEYTANHLSSDTALSGGVYYSGCTSMQRKVGIEDSKKEWRKYIDAVSDGYADSDMMDVWQDEAPKNFDWLVDLGVDFPEKLMYMSGNELALKDVTKPVPRGYITKQQSGSAIADALYKRAKELKVNFEFSTTAEKLYTDKDGRVVGVATNKGNFRARKGVVVASAGFSRNKEWIRSFKPELASGGSFGSARQQGDGIRMGMDIGANIANMWITQADTIGTKTSDTMYPCMVIAIWKLPCIFVSADGKRHMPEDMYYEYQAKEIAKQPGGFVWSIWDQSITDKGGQTITVPACSDGCEREIKEGYFKKADTIEELAKLIDIEPKTLKATVDHYNEMMRNGKDTDQGRQTGLGEVIKAPFYAAKTVPAACDTAGGLTINTNSQVLNLWKKPIAGLYAAGSTTSGWRGKIYQGSGTAISTAICFGRIAGRNIVKENTVDTITGASQSN